MSAPSAHDVESALASVTATLSAHEDRPAQREMACAVSASIEERAPLVVEAGTGTGKSLGYLIPLALAKRPAVVVTATKALQDQLISKEVPQLAAAQIPLKAAVLKGRANYLCLKKLQDRTDHPSLDLDTTETSQLVDIKKWATKTVSGERDELDFEPRPYLWASLSMTADECPGADRCPFGSACYAERSRREAAKADVVIVNAALYGAHLSTGRTLLPPHEVVVFDEAHELPDLLSRSLGAELTVARLRALSPQARPLSISGLSPVLESIHRATDSFETALLARVGTEPVGIDQSMNDALVDVEIATEALQKLLDDAAPLPGGTELERISVRGIVVHLRGDISRFLAPAPGDLIFVEGQLRPVLVAAPIDVGPLLQSLWAEVTPVLTSATIPADLDARLGLASPRHLELPSPFDYKAHSLLYVPTHISERRAPAAEVEIAAELSELIKAAGGRTLALFTSRRALEEAAIRVRSSVTTPVLVQGEQSRASLLAAFVAEESASLFATMGFWQGVDIPGRTLTLLTIDRLPFGRPDDPMLQARREIAGSRAFSMVDLPRAATLLAQGVGRLIRNADDQGVVCVFDTRLATAGYRRSLLDRLPPMARTTSKEEVLDFLKRVTQQ